jgi:hypothetical protein
VYDGKAPSRFLVMVVPSLSCSFRTGNPLHQAAAGTADPDAAVLEKKATKFGHLKYDVRSEMHCRVTCLESSLAENLPTHDEPKMPQLSAANGVTADGRVQLLVWLSESGQTE